MWALVVLGVFVLVLIGLLFMPIQLYTNTITNQYFARIGHLAKAQVEGDAAEIIRFRIWVIGYEFFFYPLKKKRKRKKKIEEPDKGRKGIKRFKPRSFGKILKAFKLKQFELNVDTGNFVANAQLYPVFGFFNHHIANCQINYEGINSLIIDIRSRPVTVLKSFINS